MIGWEDRVFASVKQMIGLEGRLLNESSGKLNPIMIYLLARTYTQK